MSRKSSVKVTIVGEEYTIRSDEPAEHTRAVAKYVDETIRGVMNAGATVESHKAAILAALQITDELFKSVMGARSSGIACAASRASCDAFFHPANEASERFAAPLGLAFFSRYD